MTLKPKVRTALGVVAFVIALAGLIVGIVGLVLHAEDASRISAQNTARITADKARQEAAKTTFQALHAGICPLVYTYENLGNASPNGSQVAAGWHGIGVLLGCPDGVKP